MEYIPVRVTEIIRQVNRDIFLLAIQREFECEPRRVERPFASIMADFPLAPFYIGVLPYSTVKEMKALR